ncbi:MoaD/ThiS family protein [Flavobacterium sp. W21_SRS_FM6]|uniref:MoaD/ThiS family protein n=1 Tax=Flavobacterium sp. W21_SRS_FM6 TaxID=3240268 RepID=UPI003F915EB1
MLKVVFFGQIRERLATDQLSLDIAQLPTPLTVKALCEYLASKGEQWRELITTHSCLIAVNQTMANLDTPINGHDEVAIFPPVTGG